MILWLDPGDTATPEHTSAVPALLSREKRSGWSPELSAAAQRPPRAVQPPGPGGSGASSEASGQDRARGGHRTGPGSQLSRPKLGQASLCVWYTETRKILPSLTYMSPQRYDAGSLLQFGSFNKSKKKDPSPILLQNWHTVVPSSSFLCLISLCFVIQI